MTVHLVKELVHGDHLQDLSEFLKHEACESATSPQNKWVSCNLNVMLHDLCPLLKLPVLPPEGMLVHHTMKP